MVMCDLKEFNLFKLVIEIFFQDLILYKLVWYKIFVCVR